MFFASHLFLVSHWSISALQKLWFMYCANCKCLQKRFNKDETNSSMLDILEVSNSVSDILGSWRDRRGLVSVSLSSWLWVAVCLAFLALEVEVLPKLLRGPISFACRTQYGFSHKQVVKSENVGHKSLWKLGSLVAPDFCPTACKWSHCNVVHAFAFTGVCNNHLLVRAKGMTLFQIILFPTSTVPDALCSDKPLRLPCLYY